MMIEKFAGVIMSWVGGREHKQISSILSPVTICESEDGAHLKSDHAIPLPLTLLISGSSSSAPPHSLASGRFSLHLLTSSSSYSLDSRSALSGLSAVNVSCPGNFIFSVVEGSKLETSGRGGRLSHNDLSFDARSVAPSLCRNWDRVGLMAGRISAFGGSRRDNGGGANVVGSRGYREDVELEAEAVEEEGEGSEL
jgi:hypothetical protein